MKVDIKPLKLIQEQQFLKMVKSYLYEKLMVNGLCLVDGLM